jgi:hypothetical protein
MKYPSVAVVGCVPERTDDLPAVVNIPGLRIERPWEVNGAKSIVPRPQESVNASVAILVWADNLLALIYSSDKCLYRSRNIQRSKCPLVEL